MTSSSKHFLDQFKIGSRLSFAAGADMSIDIFRKTLYQKYSVHLTMVYVFFTNKDDRSKYKLSRDEIIFVTLVILFWLLNLLNTLFQPEGL